MSQKDLDLLGYVISGDKLLCSQLLFYLKVNMIGVGGEFKFVVHSSHFLQDLKGPIISRSQLLIQSSSYSVLLIKLKI